MRFSQISVTLTQIFGRLHQNLSESTQKAHRKHTESTQKTHILVKHTDLSWVLTNISALEKHPILIYSNFHATYTDLSVTYTETLTQAYTTRTQNCLSPSFFYSEQMVDKSVIYAKQNEGLSKIWMYKWVHICSVYVCVRILLRFYDSCELLRSISSL